jgi:hypothetical protein
MALQKRFPPDSLRRINDTQDIMEKYEKQGLKLSLRQLYYLAVKAGIIKNHLRSLSLFEGELKEVFFHNEFERENLINQRVPRETNGFLFDETGRKCDFNKFRLDRWENQTIRPEIWIEKPIFGLAPWLFRELDVDCFFTYGEPTKAEIWSAGRRFVRRSKEKGQSTFVLFLGDFDEFGPKVYNSVRLSLEDILPCSVFTIKKLLVNESDGREFSLIPYPKAVMCGEFRKKFGLMSFEIESVDPFLLLKKLREEIGCFLNKEKRKEVLAREREITKSLKIENVI